MRPYPYNVKVDSRYGAPMGRSDKGVLNDGERLHIKAVPLDPYDGGGAYWGFGGTLWCAFSASRSIVRYMRVATRAEVRALLAEEADDVVLLEWDGAAA